jgi:tetratricopeptide (TPR) repeat protein
VIRFLEERVKSDPADMVALNRLADEYLRRFRETGDDRDLARSAEAAGRSLAAVPAAVNKGGLAARARAALALHRFAAARDDALQLVELDPAKRYPLDLLADALVELGEYDKAADVHGKIEQFGGDPDPATEWRLARLAQLRGDNAAARRRLAAAVKLAPTAYARAPEAFAWARVRAGEFAFNTGDWEAAERHYRAALDVRPDDWPALDHLAELRAAQKRYDEAVSLYRQVVARVPRPELFQALGDVFKVMGKDDEAKHWHRQALEKYLKAAEAGSAHYYHHLAGFYSDTDPNPAEAVKWARKDLEARRSIYAHDALAWALYHAGDYAAAAEAMDKALALGTRDAHLLYHASLIYYRTGDAQKGKDCLRRAGESNPKFMEFHVHR